MGPGVGMSHNDHFSLSDQICKDYNKDCEYWAMIGECTANPGFMTLRCRKSCKVCGDDGGGDPGNKHYSFFSQITYRNGWSGIQNRKIVGQKQFAPPRGGPSPPPFSIAKNKVSGIKKTFFTPLFS